MLIYIEYKSRNPGVDLEHFHTIARRNYQGWSNDNPEDALLLSLGRTWRVGPEPSYLIVYFTPNKGLERLGEWQEIFKSGTADHLEAPSRVAGRIDEAGCYVPLLEPLRGAGGPYYAELFDFAPGSTRSDVTDWYQARRDQHADLTLHLVADRIGHLGPDPRGVAVWGLPDYGALEAIATEVHHGSSQTPVRLMRAALYEDCGEEVL
jgi:hypothetical protein